MKKIILVVVFNLSFVLANAQALSFDWAKQMGVDYGAHAFASTVDAWGNVYTTGYFEGTGDFDPGPGIYTLSAPLIGPGNKYIIIPCRS